MNSRFASISAAALVLVATSSANAVQRTFVASYGNDANPCSLVQPCRALEAAFALTSAGGEVIVLDAAGYGPLTINQAVSIIAPPGIYAGISVLSGNGVTVAAGASDVVVLRGLTINGQGGLDGIRAVSAREIHIEHCTIANMLNMGIRIEGETRMFIRNTIARSNAYGLSLQGTPSSEVYVVDSHFSRNGGGIFVAGGTLTATRISVENNTGHGIEANQIPPFSDMLKVGLVESVLAGNGGAGAHAANAWNSVRMEMARSTSIRNALAGISISSTPATTAVLVVTESSIVDNGTDGVVADGSTATAVVTGSTVAGNVGADVAQKNSAVVRTSGNNTLTGRGAADVSGTLTPNPMR